MEYLRTDLALENKEKFENDEVEIKGVKLDKKELAGGKILLTKVTIVNDAGARMMGKKKGNYITIESIGAFEEKDNENMESVVINIIAKELSKMIDIEKNKSILIVGLGNREVTPDALGPKVVDKLDIEVMQEDSDRVRLYAVNPGVMAQSGMESAMMVKALVKTLKVDAVIAIDSLAARRVERLNRVIQIADTGIAPGSGIGNYRNELCKESLGVPVIALGVPLVVNAATIICDAVDTFLASCDYEKLEDKIREDIMGKIIKPSMFDMFVTPDSIDESIQRMSDILSRGINKMARG